MSGEEMSCCCWYQRLMHWDNLTFCCVWTIVDRRRWARWGRGWQVLGWSDWRRFDSAPPCTNPQGWRTSVSWRIFWRAGDQKIKVRCTKLRPLNGVTHTQGVLVARGWFEVVRYHLCITVWMLCWILVLFNTYILYSIFLSIVAIL